MELSKAIATRRSIRKYRSGSIPSKLLCRILEASIWAPSAHNAQPWRFIILNREGVKRRLAEAMAKKYEDDLISDGMPPEKCKEIANSSIERFASAPILIVACLTMKDMDKYPDEGRMKAEYNMAVQSVAAAIQNMLLTAHAEGLGACWFCAPLFCPDVVADVLDLPDEIEPQALITLGYPDEKPDPPPRLSIGEVVHYNCWGSKE